MVQVVIGLLPFGAATAAPIEQSVLDEAVALAASVRSQRLLSGLPTIPSSAYVDVAAGRIATGVQDTGGALKRVWGIGVVDASAADLQAAISDDERKPKFTSLSKVQVLSGKPCSSGRIVFQYLDVSLLSDRWWVVEQRVNTGIASGTSGRVRELVWTAVSDGASHLTPELATFVDGAVQVPATEGSWLLVDLGNGKSLVEYVQSSDPGGAVPASLAASMASRSIGDAFAAMAAMTRSPGACATR